jgi:hypothetical protein
MSITESRIADSKQDVHSRRIKRVVNHMNRLFDKRVLEQLRWQTGIHGLGRNEGVRGWVANAAQLGSGRGKGLVLVVLRFWRNTILERRRGHVEADLRNNTVMNGGMGWLAQGARLVVTQIRGCTRCLLVDANGCQGVLIGWFAK